MRTCVLLLVLVSGLTACGPEEELAPICQEACADWENGANVDVGCAFWPDGGAPVNYGDRYCLSPYVQVESCESWCQAFVDGTADKCNTGYSLSHPTKCQP
jgi:hypothetical protein